MDIIEDKNVSAEEALSKFAVDWSEEVTNHVSFRVPSIDKIFTDKGLLGLLLYPAEWIFFGTNVRTPNVSKHNKTNFI